MLGYAGLLGVNAIFGSGAFGVPTGAEVYVLGISHADFGAVISGQPKVRREFTLFDETAVWKQILLQTGA